MSQRPPWSESWRRTAVAFCASSAVAVAVMAVRAQDAATPQAPIFRGGVDVVQLDVTVLDKDRKPVRGLTAADFTVLEDGAPTSIVGFAPMDLPEPVAPTAAWMRDVGPDVVTNTDDVGRLITIVFDDANTDPWVARDGQAIARAVIDGLGPNDRAAVVFTFMGRTQNFTNDRARLLAAIATYTPKDSLEAGPPLSCQFKGVAGCVLTTLENVARALPAVPARRKLLVFVSAGKQVPGLSMEEADHSRAYAPSIDDTVRLFRALQEANVTIYGFSPSGLQVANNRRADEALQSLSEETGGRATIQTNAPWTAVPAMLEQSRAYYLIAFQSTKRDGRFHRIHVRVNRPDAEVRTRSGYLAEPRKAPKPPKPLTPLEAALSSGFHVSGVPIESSAAAFAVPGRAEAAAVVTTAVRPGASALSTPRGVTVRASAFDREWRDKATIVQTFQMTSATDTSVGTVHATLRLRPGRYELRVAAETDGRAGSVFADLEIPPFATESLSASGLVVGRPVGVGGFPVVDGLTLPVEPTAARAFRRDDPVSVFLRAYQQRGRDPEPVTVRVTVLDDLGLQSVSETRSLAATDFRDSRSADVEYRLPIDRLGLGEHLLTIDLTRRDHTVTKTMRFTITTD